MVKNIWIDNLTDFLIFNLHQHTPAKKKKTKKKKLKKKKERKTEFESHHNKNHKIIYKSFTAILVLLQSYTSNGR